MPATGAPYSRAARGADHQVRSERSLGEGRLPEADGARGWEGLSAQGPPRRSQARVFRDLAWLSPELRLHKSPPRAGRSGCSWGEGGEGGTAPPGPTSALLLPAVPSGTTRLPAARLPRAESGLLPERTGVKGQRELNFHLRDGSLLLGASASLRNLSENGGRDSRRGASHHGGQDLLSRIGGLCGGCDHLPAGHGQSPATGRERDGEGVHLRQRDLIPALIYLSKGR